MTKPVFEVSDLVKHKPGLYGYKRWLEAQNFGFRKWRDCTIRVAKTKALIGCAVYYDQYVSGGAFSFHVFCF